MPYFMGKDKIIRALYSPDRNLNSGEKFVTNYFNKRYEGITSNYIDWGVYFKGGLEKGLVNYIRTEISQFRYFLDIGSNSGTISLPFCKERDLKIICFEPLEYSYEKLLKNYRINNAFENHIFHKIALSNETKKSYLNFSNIHSNIGTASLNPKHFNFYNDKKEVCVERLDNLYNFKNQSLFIKIDVEGHEDKLIEGANSLIKNNKILMYLETTNTILLNKLKKEFNIFFPRFIEGNYEFLSKQYLHNVILKNY